MERPTERKLDWRWQERIGVADRKTLDGDQSVYFNRLMDIGDPIEPYDVANKKYVDDAVSSGGGGGDVIMIEHLATYNHANIHPSDIVDGDPVDVTGRDIDDVLAWNGTTWVPVPPSVSVVGENINDALIWNGAAWVPVPVILADGSVTLSADWDAGSHGIKAQTFESDQVTGTAPFVVASTTKVTNLNADKLDGLDDTAFLKHILATAANDFLVASGSGTFVKKTLAETQAMLGCRWSLSEIPTGVIDGSNVTFTLAHTPTGGQIMLYLNGQYMTVGVGEDYILSGITITMAAPLIPGDKIRTNYQY